MTKHTPATPLPTDRHFDCMKRCPMDCAKVCKRIAYPRLVADAKQNSAALTSLYLMCADKAFSKSPQVREFAAMLQRELDAGNERTRALLAELGE